jgi:acetolactate synthase-1/2/3 large subunit
MRAAELFVRCLENEGVEYIFGVPGEENAEFVMALEDSPIRFMLCRHEQGAAFMADVYGRLTGKAGVCLGTLGPGATNLVTGVADGNMDRAPMVVITGQAAVVRQHKESHQAMNVVEMFRPITKWAQPIIHTGNIPEIVRKAFKLAQTEKPGACHIELADDLAGWEVEDNLEPVPARRPRRPVPDDKIIDRAWDVLRECKDPVILAGNGCIRKRARRQLQLFAEATGICTINTFMAKGAVSCDAPYSAHTIGLQSRDYPWIEIEEADAVVCLGFDMVEYSPKLWNPNKDKTIIHMDFLPAEVDECYIPKVEVVGDLAHTLWMLNERVKQDPVQWDVNDTAKTRKAMQADFEEWKDDTADRVKPQKALWDARQVLGREDILLSDVGAHKMWVARYYQCYEPNTCLISNGFCSMGFSLPGAIAAKLVNPDKRVMAVCGDGGFLMNLQEMETAKRFGTNIVVNVWADQEYGLIGWKQRNRFDGKQTNLSFNNPNFVTLAESFGWQGWWVENSADLAEALENAFECGDPALVAMPIDYDENDKLSKRLGQIAMPI